MRQSLLFGGTYAPGEVKSHTAQRGHLNGLLFIFENNSADNRLTVTRRVGRNTHLMVPNFRVRDLRRISNVEFGYDFTSDGVIARLNEGMKAKLTAAGSVWTQADFDNYVQSVYGLVNGATMIYVPLGSIYLGDSSELDISFSCDKAWAQSYPVRCYAISNERRPDFMYQTDYSLQLEQTHRNVDALYLVTKAHTGQANSHMNWLAPVRTPDITIQLVDDDEATLSDWSGHYAATNIFGRVEAHQTSEIAILYRRRDVLPAEVFAKITGNDAGLVELVVRRVVFDQGQVSANTLAELKQLTGRVAKLESSNPDAAKALRHAGEIGKSSQLSETAQVISSLNAADRQDR